MKMGLFDVFKKKGIVLGSPLEGECVSLKQVNDPTFSEEILGKGIAVVPVDGKVYAPADCEITTVFPHRPCTGTHYGGGCGNPDSHRAGYG